MDAMKERASAPGGCWKLRSIRLHQGTGGPRWTEAYDGRQVVGMDLHRRRSVLVRMTKDGRKLETVRIDEQRRRRCGRCWPGREVPAGGARGDVRVVLGRGRAGGGRVRRCTWRIRWASRRSAYRRVKNDERDAADLADLLRMGRLPEAWIAPAEVRELRELTRYRHKLVAAADQLQGPGARGAGQARRPGHAARISSARGGRLWLDQLVLPPAVCREGGLAAAADRGADRRDRPARGAGSRDLLAGDRGYAAIRAAARDRPGAGRGDRRRDRRHHPVPRARRSCAPGPG